MNMNIIIPGGRRSFGQNKSEHFVRQITSTVGPNCWLYILCQTMEEVTELDSISLSSTKLVVLIAGLEISDFFGRSFLSDEQVFQVVNNSNVFCQNVTCPVLQIMSKSSQ